MDANGSGTAQVAMRGEMAELIERTDFSQTGLGPRESWPQSLRTALSICLSSRFPMIIFWGPRLCVLYNDAYIPIFARKHPSVLGKTGFEAWGEVWDVIEPMFEAVMKRGEATWSHDQLLVLERKGFAEETYLTWSYSPIADESGGVGGVFTAVFETTERVLGERRLVTLRELGAQAASAKSIPVACETAAQTLGKNAHDVPFALLYLLDGDGKSLRLAANAGLKPGTAASPQTVALDEPSGWPLREVVRSGEVRVVRDALQRFGELPGGPWPEPAQTAVVLPIASADASHPFGVLVAGTSPRLELDAAYLDFFELASNHVASAIASAHAYEEERRRAEALAEIDRAKTAFFSNVSHEFRTPLTLMIGPLEDALARPGSSLSGESLVTAHRNSLRLLKLVNALLDFSRIEAGRVRARYEPTDLARCTRELASAFESTMQRANLRYEIDCAPLSQPVYVDREMWEKIVLNLISNAFKFTFEGGVRLALHAAADQVELSVSDSGIGIEPEELPRVFERFHRIEGAKARTHEGSGIGLALVHELARLHGGSVEVQSVVGKGSTFTVRLPFGFAHLPQDRIGAPRDQSSNGMGAAAFVEEAQRWIPAAAGAEPAPDEPGEYVRDARILVADDNADMREYVCRLLSLRWSVAPVADGAAALEAARSTPPDLIVSDVMMPELDGYELLRRLRDDARTRAIPVIFLSARAGEEARVEGLEAGADDYLVKPFAARELIARVNTHLELARLRADTESLRRITASLAAELDLGKLLQLITDEATRLVGARFGAFFYNVVDGQGERYTHYTLSGAPREAFSKFPMPRNTGIFAPTFRGEAVIRLHDVKQDPRYGKNAPYQGMPAGHLPVRSYLAAPVKSRSGEVLGGLFFGHEKPGMFSERAERLLVAVAAQGSIAIENARLYERSKKQQEQVRELLQREQAARAGAESAGRAKDEFLAILGHELRNPLAPILTAMQLMRLRGDDTSLRERTVIERQVSHLVRLVDDLLDVSRITRGKVKLDRQRIELAELVARAIEMVSPLIEQKQHRLTVSLPRSGLEIDGDPVRLAQVVGNLLTNAAKYTPPGGDITVSGRRDAGDVVLRVRDNGIGISASTLSRIFDPFVQERQTLDRSQGGLGLGLTIVRNLVMLHGGTVEVLSAGRGKGSEFIVRLPHSAGAIDASATGASAQPRKRDDAQRILVVDDNADAADMLAESLRAMGHLAEVTYDGPSALALATDFRPHVVLLDIGLPVMDGYEVAKRLRDLPPLSGARLIALTGYGQESDRAATRAAGFDDHLVKPIPIDRVISVIERPRHSLPDG